MEEEQNCPEKRAIIDKSTLMPIALVIVIASMVWGAATLNSKVNANEDRLNKVETAIVKITDVQVQLSGIAVQIDALQKQINELK